MLEELINRVIVLSLIVQVNTPTSTFAEFLILEAAAYPDVTKGELSAFFKIASKDRESPRYALMSSTAGNRVSVVIGKLYHLFG
jgi:hypothetical protein